MAPTTYNTRRTTVLYIYIYSRPTPNSVAKSYYLKRKIARAFVLSKTVFKTTTPTGFCSAVRLLFGYVGKYAPPNRPRVRNERGNEICTRNRHKRADDDDGRFLEANTRCQHRHVSEWRYFLYVVGLLSRTTTQKETRN